MNNQASFAYSEDVIEVANWVDASDSEYSRDDVIGACRSLLVPQPAWHLKAVVDATTRLVRREEDFFSAHYDHDKQFVGALTAMSHALAAGEWRQRQHLIDPLPDGDPFRNKCLGSAPLYSSVILRSVDQPSVFDRILAECLGAGMSLCDSQLTSDDYLRTLHAAPHENRLPIGHSRLDGVGRALRWLSNDAPSTFLEALGADHSPGSLLTALDEPSLHLKLELSALEGDSSSGRERQVSGSERIETLKLFLRQAVLGEQPSGGGTGSGGGGGGRAVQGNYQISDGPAMLVSGRDFTEDYPESPTTVMAIGATNAPLENGHPTEVQAPDQLILIRPDGKDLETSLGAQILAARHKAALIDRTNQALPFAWGTSTKEEVAQAVVLARSESATEEAVQTAMVISALLATGCPAKGLPDIRWASGDEPWRSDIEYDLKRRCWRFGGQTPAFLDEDSRDADTACVIPAESIELPDYYNFHRFFKGDIESLTRRKQVFGSSTIKLRAVVQNVLAPLRNDGSRLTLERVGNILGQTLYQQTQDIGPRATLLADASMHSHTVAHYQVTTTKRLEEDYRSAQLQIARELVNAWDRKQALARTQDASDAEPHNLWVSTSHLGSHRLPLLVDLQARIAKVKEVITSNARLPIESIGDADIDPQTDHRVVFHNAFVQYVASWNMFEAAMRAINDPSPALVDQIVELAPASQARKRMAHRKQTSNIGFISDKDRGTRYLDRLACYSDDLMEQCDIWDRHAKHIRRLAAINGIKASGDVFFTIDRRGKQQELRTKDFQTGAFQLPYSANVFRRVVRSYLSDRRVNGEFIDAYLGQGRRGTERWGIYSTLSMPDVSKVITPHLDELRREIGWTVLESPHAH